MKSIQNEPQTCLAPDADYWRKTAVSKIFKNELYTFIQQGCITLIKSDRKIIIYKNLQLQEKYIFITESWKKVSWFYKKK